MILALNSAPPPSARGPWWRCIGECRTSSRLPFCSTGRPFESVRIPFPPHHTGSGRIGHQTGWKSKLPCSSASRAKTAKVLLFYLLHSLIPDPEFSILNSDSDSCR